MKKLFVIAIGVFLANLIGCASVKDENGKTVGTCFGAGCVLRAAFDANTIDSKTGYMKGTVPLFSVGGKAASAPTVTTTTDKAADVHAAASNTTETATPAAK